MNFEGEFRTLTKNQVIEFLDMNSTKELKMKEKSVKD